jgi:hypothetical protein
MSSLPRGILGSLRPIPDAKNIRAVPQSSVFSNAVSRPLSPSKVATDGHSPLTKPVIIVPKPAKSISIGKTKALPGLTPLQPISSSLVAENAEQPTVFDADRSECP